MPEYAHRDSLHPLHPFTHIVTLPSFKITAEGYGKDYHLSIIFVGSQTNFKVQKRMRQNDKQQRQ